MLVTCTHDTPLGPLPIVASEQGLRAILWPDDREGRVRFEEVPKEVDAADDEVLSATVAWLDAYVADPETDAPTPPLDLVGTAFQVDVWHALLEIPSGVTTSYGELANLLGRPTGARAVGSAVGRNPVSILVPCHRVMGASGALTGFAGGLDAKRWLLDHEAGVRALV